MKNEFEATYLSINKDELRSKLKNSGFELKHPEYIMRRKTFDFLNKVSGIQKWGRVRQEFSKTTMTIKEVRGSGINDTYEVEVTVNDFDTAVELFEACGLSAKAFQENKRELWVFEDVEATIDTWPALNPFIEIEAPNEERVKNISNQLSLDYSEAFFGSIDKVYEKELGISSATIINLSEITFDNPPRIK